MSASTSSVPPSALEASLARAGRHPRFLAGSATVPVSRLTATLEAVNVELDAPRPPLLTRVLRRLRVPDRTIPLVTATPGLRRSWLAAVLVALLFAINAADNSGAAGTERIVVFLTIAPLVPTLGVALAFGRGVDPTHEIIVAAPMDAFRVFLVRAATVLTASTAILLLASARMPEGGAARVAWLLPALAITAVTMALATRIEPRAAAGAAAAAWISIVVGVTQASDAGAAFGPLTQIACLAVVTASAVVFVRRRRRFDFTATDGDP